MSTPLKIDFVSDVSCPWCIIGLRGLTEALDQLGTEVQAEIHFQPFELNPNMPAEGQNIVEHITEKYGSTAEESQANRARIRDMGAALGFGCGLLLGQSRRLRRWLTPYLVLSQVTPKLALAPLFIVWFGFGLLPTVVMTALICFFPLLENTLSALDQTDARQLELFRALGASRWQTLWRLQLPAGRHTLAAGLRVALVLAWVGAVVSEFISASHGLGAVIIGAQGSMDTALMFAALALIAGLGITSYALLGALERRWH